MDIKKEAPAKPQSRRVWYYFLVVGLAALLLYLAVRGGSWEEVWRTIRGSHLGYLGLALLIGTVSIFMRSLRWGVLLSAEKWIHPLLLFWATNVGYLANTFLPARAGEVIRSVLLGASTGINGAYVLATALTERIMDVLALVLTGVLIIPGIEQIPDWLPSTIKIMGIAAVGAMVVLFILPYQEALVRKISAVLPFPLRWREKIDSLTTQALLGAKAFRSLPRMSAFVGLTAVIWLLDGFSGIQVAKALNLELTLPQILLLLIALGLSSAIPSTPGYVGIYQFVAVTVLPLFGFTRNQALSYILVSQANTILLITFWGLPGLWFLNKGRPQSKPTAGPPVSDQGPRGPA